nr:MAG TPA: virion structural protein [Caudoviricetes sp.]
MAGTSDRWSQNPLQTTASSNNMDWMKTNQKDYSKFRYFLSGVDVTRQNLSAFTPYERGYARLFVYNMPVFMEKFFPELTKRFKSYLETGYRSVNGISDLSVEFNEYEGGFAGQKFANVNISHDDTDTITIGLYELAGSPIREFLETWITGVRDPRSGVAHYHGHVATPIHPADGTNYIEYAEKNHTMELIYFTTDATAKRVEYACLLAHCFPGKSDRDHLNYESNSHDTAEVELELRTTKYESRYINDIASFFLAADTIKYSYLDFNPFHDEQGNQRSYSEAQTLVNTANSTFANSADATDTAWK